MSARITAEVIKDSICEGKRITTFKTRFPKFILAEFNTHRALSRNSASSRAIPIQKQLKIVEDTPWMPKWVGKNQRGMAASERISEEEYDVFALNFITAKDECCDAVTRMLGLGIHKQHASRYLEPWMMVDHISTATDWANFFLLRCHPAAQPEIQELAYKMLRAYYYSEPDIVEVGEWHIPFDATGGLTIGERVHIATARCARISYENFDGVIDPESDYKLYDTLLKQQHLSPFEHCAKALPRQGRFFNLDGWKSHRYDIESNIERKPFTKKRMEDLLINKPSWIDE